MIANHVEIPEDGKDARQAASVLPRWLCLRVCEVARLSFSRRIRLQLQGTKRSCTAHADNAMRWLATWLTHLYSLRRHVIMPLSRLDSIFSRGSRSPRAGHEDRSQDSVQQQDAVVDHRPHYPKGSTLPVDALAKAPRANEESRSMKGAPKRPLQGFLRPP